MPCDRRLLTPSLARFLLVAIAFALAPLAGSTQHEHGQAATGAPSPPRLFDNLGGYRRKVSMKSPEARRYFDQGLRLVYAFNHDEAQRAFEHAALLDPDCGICWWGAALALGPNINLPALPDRAAAAWTASRKALALADKAGPVERALIEAVSKRYSSPPPSNPETQKALDTVYAEAMRGVYRRFPKDLDVATLYAESMMDLRPWDLWTLDGKAQPGTPEIVAALEKVLAASPEHPGANHYYIHAVEASPAPGKALPSAKRLETMMPGAGHVVHMPSHVYIRTGRYAEGSEANRRAIAADRTYVEAAKPQGFYAMYIGHNHQFLMATTMMEGRSAESIRAARETVAASPVEMLKEMPGFDFLLTYPSLALARFGKWEDVLREPAPPEEFPFAMAIWHYARGVAFARTGRLVEAAAERDALSGIEARTLADARESLNSASALLGIASKTLAGQIAAKRGEREESIRLLREAVAAEDGLSYAEPPDWLVPVRHSLGAVLLEAGRPREAEVVYRKDLRRNPNNGWALFGLTLSLKAQKKTRDAAESEARFREVWKGADVTLTGSEF